MMGEGGGFDVVFREPCLGFLAGGDEGVDAEEDRWLLIEGGELRFPEIAEFGVADLVDPIGDGLANGARLIVEERLVGENFIGWAAVVLVPIRKFVTHS